jgi:predicted Zn finger-like uncharacterized protein
MSACQAKYSIADDKIQGKAFKIRCKKCSHVIVVKVGGDAAAAPASTAAPAPVAVESSKAVAAEQGVWHVVVDGEQVGPLTEGGVRERLSQGKINSDTLVWKDGMGDWTALSTVPELAAVFAKVPQHAPANPAAHTPARKSAGMKAAVPAAEAPSSSAMAAGDDDVFAAPTVVTPSGSAGLIAVAAAAPAHVAQAHSAPVHAAPAAAPSSAFLFGGSPAQAPEQVVVRNPGNGAGGTHLTGQRNENSVLFSLSNLEALAVPSHSAGVRAPSGSSNTEGSGLIDIRSMAAMTLGEGGDARRSADALPTFSTPQFSPVAPVLLPMSTSGPPNWVYPILGLLAIGIAALGYGIYKIATAPAPGAAPIVQPVAVPVAPVAPAQPAIPVPAVVPAAPAQAAPEAAKPATPEGHAASEEKSTDKGRAGKGDKGHHRGGESKGSSETKKGSEVVAAPTAPPPAPATDASKSGATKPTAKKGGRSLDDLLGEVGTKKSGDEGSSKPAAAAASAKLISLTQSDIVGAMKGVQPKVQACANQFKVPGTAMAQISVASGGRVSSATVTGKFAGTPTGSCVEVAAKSAKFPPCQSMSFPWPFTLSPR